MFLLHRKHIVSDSKGGTIRRWCLGDGVEVGTPTLVPLTTLRCRNMIVIGGLSAGDSSYVGQVLYSETSHMSTSIMLLWPCRWLRTPIAYREWRHPATRNCSLHYWV